MRGVLCHLVVLLFVVVGLVVTVAKGLLVDAPPAHVALFGLMAAVVGVQLATTWAMTEAFGRPRPPRWANV